MSEARAESDPYDLQMAFGTLEEGRAWIGRTLPTRTAIAPVSAHTGRLYAALLEDANASYWDGSAYPPGLLMGFDFRFPWHPDPHYDLRPSRIVREIPLPGHTLINVGTDTEFFTPLVVGDLISVQGEVVDVSETKHTRIGSGSFIATRSTFRNQRGDVCATNLNTLFRYDAEVADDHA